MIEGPTIKLVKGTSRDFRFQAVKDKNLTAWTIADPSPFLASDTLVTKVWYGNAQVSLLTPTTSWIDNVTAKFQVTFNDADTAAFLLGRYRIQTTVARAGRTAVPLDGFLEITSIPGTDVRPLAFTKYSDILFYAPWIESLQTDEDEEAFINHQARSTNHLIDMLVQQWQPDAASMSSDSGGSMLLSGGSGVISSPSNWLRQQLVPLVPGSVVPVNMPDRVSPVGTIVNYVDATVSTALMLYPEVKEIVAKWVIADICEEQIGLGGGGKAYQDIASRFKREASSLYRTRSFEIDLGNPQTGFASFVIHGGSTRL